MESALEFHPGLPPLTKQPLGGVDRRSLVGLLAKEGADAARAELAAHRAHLHPTSAGIAADTAVLLLGGSNGILRAVAIELVFGQGIAVFAVHHDSEKLQIGPHHARAITEAANAVGSFAVFENNDATRPEVIASVVGKLRERFRAVHLVNGIAAGAPKRLPAFGPTKVADLDVAFDPVRQVPDFRTAAGVRAIGMVDVEVATEAEIERTSRLMGTSTTPWAEALAAAGLLASGESVVAFADYDYHPDDPVYAHSPLATAKAQQREALRELSIRFGIRPMRLCYPAMNTTAIGAIPGGALTFAGTAQVLLERGEYRSVAQLGGDTVKVFGPGFPGEELRCDEPYRRAHDEFRRRLPAWEPSNIHAALDRVIGYDGL